MRLHAILFIVLSIIITSVGFAQASPDVLGSQGNVIVNGGDAVITDGGVILRAKTLPSVGAQLGGSAGKFVIFNAANAELLRVTNAGLVGIGTNNPKGTLHLAWPDASREGGVGPELVLQTKAGAQNDAAAITFYAGIYPRLQLFFGVDTNAFGDLQIRKLYPPVPSGTTPPSLLKLTGRGELMVFGGPVPLTLRYGTAAMYWRDLAHYEGVPNGMRMEMPGNSEIHVANLQLGYRTEPIISAINGAREVVVQPRLNARNLSGHADLAVTSGNDPGIHYSPALTLQRLDGNNSLMAAYGFHLDPADNKLKLLYSATRDFTDRTTLPAPLMTIAPAANGLPAQLSFNGAIIGAVFQDLAEWVPSTTDMPPGTVVVLNPDKTNEVMASEREYDARVAGVVSAQPGLLLGPGGEGKEMIATTGRVRVKVDAAQPIRVGDLLVSSNKAGMAMKSQPLDFGGVAIHRPGTIIGKALEPLQSGEGEILVLLSLQ